MNKKIIGIGIIVSIIISIIVAVNLLIKPKVHIEYFNSNIKRYNSSDEIISGKEVLKAEKVKLVTKGEDDVLLPNVKYQATSLEEGKSEVYDFSTDDKGEISLDLPKGLYKIVQIEALEGYELPEKEYYIKIDEAKPEIKTSNYILSKSISGDGVSNIYDIENTTDGGYVVVGTFNGSISLNQDETLTSKGDYDAFVAKYNSEGNLEWSKNYGTTGKDGFNCISVTNDGYVVGGYEYKKGKYEDGVLVKLSSNGEESWKKYVEGDLNDEIRDLKVLEDGNIVIVGKYCSSTISIAGKDSLSKKGKFNGFIAYMSSNGELLWSKNVVGYKATDSADVTSVTITSKGIVVAVNFFGQIKAGENLSIVSVNDQDLYLIGYDFSGNSIWNKQITAKNSESVEELTTDNEDNIVLVGSFASDLEIDSHKIVCPTTTNSNALMLKFDSNGKYINSSYTFGGNDGDDILTSAIPMEDGGLILAGWFYSSSIDLDGDGKTEIDSNKGNNEGIIVRLDKDNKVLWYRTINGTSYESISGITELEEGKIVVVGNYDSQNVFTNNDSSILTSSNYNNAYLVNLEEKITQEEVPEEIEIEVKNSLKQFEIKYEIGTNSAGETKGGTIKGINNSEGKEGIIEKVKYGYDSLNQIEISPDTDYLIYSIEINNEKFKFIPDSSGKVILPIFKEVKEDIKIKVIFEKGMSSVLVHHYLKQKDGTYTNQKLSEDEYFIGKIGTEYNTSPRKDIDGYEPEIFEDGIYKFPENKSGVFGDEPIVITYYYQPMGFSLIVHHYLEGTEIPLVKDEIYRKFEDDFYTISPNSELLNKYILLEDLTQITPSDAGLSGNIKQDIIVTFYYRLKEEEKSKGKVIVHHYLEGTTENVLLENGQTAQDEILEGFVGDTYETTPLTDISSDYILSKTPDNATGKFINGDIDVIYYYTLNKNYKRVIIKYFDEETNKEIVQEDIINGYLNSDYETQPKVIEGYELVKEKLPNNAKGKLTTEDILVKYYYRKINSNIPEIPSASKDNQNIVTDNNTTIENKNTENVKAEDVNTGDNIYISGLILIVSIIVLTTTLIFKIKINYLK